MCLSSESHLSLLTLEKVLSCILVSCSLHKSMFSFILPHRLFLLLDINQSLSILSQTLGAFPLFSLQPPAFLMPCHKVFSSSSSSCMQLLRFRSSCFYYNSEKIVFNIPSSLFQILSLRMRQNKQTKGMNLNAW